MNANDERKERHRRLFLDNLRRSGNPRWSAQALGYRRLPPFLDGCKGWDEAMDEYKRRKAFVCQKF